MKEFLRNMFGKPERQQQEGLTEEQRQRLGEEVAEILEDPEQVNRIDIGLGRKKDGESSGK